MTIFTQSEYLNILLNLRTTHEFIGIDEITTQKRFCLLRHDIDFSINRALVIAKLEADNDIKSTFYINPHSEFYNLFEKQQADKIRNILALGHNLGLHFDASFYGGIDLKFESHLVHERSQLENLFDCQVNSFSFHNTTEAILAFDDDKYAGMVNCYSQKLRALPYCSDSTGIWRYDNLIKFIEKNSHQNLHILTHPGWWLGSDMLPRAKVHRACIGRAKSQLEIYDTAFQKHKSSIEFYGDFHLFLNQIEDKILLSHCDYFYHEELFTELYIMLLRYLYGMNAKHAKKMESSLLPLNFSILGQHSNAIIRESCFVLVKEIAKCNESEQP